MHSLNQDGDRGAGEKRADPICALQTDLIGLANRAEKRETITSYS